MKESKEETKLQSEQKEILTDEEREVMYKLASEYSQKAMDYTKDFHDGINAKHAFIDGWVSRKSYASQFKSQLPSDYEESLARNLAELQVMYGEKCVELKFMTELAEERHKSIQTITSDFFRVRDENFKLKKDLESQLPIEQKSDYKVERQRFIDDYANNRERENMRDSLGRIFDMWIIPLACRIKELESQPSPIEGVEREQFSIEDMKAAFEAGRDHQYHREYGSIKKWRESKFDQWLATRKGSTETR